VTWTITDSGAAAALTQRPGVRPVVKSEVVTRGERYAAPGELLPGGYLGYRQNGQAGGAG
jgi:hypothetical protein